MVAIDSILFRPLLLAFAASQSSFHEQSTIKMTDSAESIISKLRSLGMEKKDMPHIADRRRASVLVPLFERVVAAVGDNDSAISNSNSLHVLLTQRPQNMKSHGGEVCFPGGKQDPEDEGDDVRTAMREAHEEVGLHPQHVESISRMESLESKHGLCVTPIIGLISPSSVAEPSQLTLNADEVEAAFAVPLEYFVDPENCDSAVPVNWGGKNFLLRTYLYDDPESGRQFKIWGFTAHVVHEVAMKAFAVHH